MAHVVCYAASQLCIHSQILAHHRHDVTDLHQLWHRSTNLTRLSINLKRNLAKSKLCVWEKTCNREGFFCSISVTFFCFKIESCLNDAEKIGEPPLGRSGDDFV